MKGAEHIQERCLGQDWLCAGTRDKVHPHGLNMALRISAALDAAWQIAADTAMHGDSPYIEPIHLLYGLFQLAKGPSRSSGRTPAQFDEIRTESSQLAEIFDGLSPDFSALEHSANYQSQSKKMSRSAESTRLFEKATLVAERTGD